MVLDLALMRSVSVDTQAQTVTFGGGCLWYDVDNALAEHKLATVGGTVSHTGVGGLTLHGGFGFLTGLHGLAVDCLLSCEVVLADGSIVNASPTETEDLFWAIRGAGSSFGVVTRFTSQAYPQGDVWSVKMILTPDKLPAVVDSINDWHERTDGNQVIGAGALYAPETPGQEPPPGGRPPCILIQVAHVGKDCETEGPKFFAKTLEIESLMKMGGMTSYQALNSGANDVLAAGHRYLFGGSNFTLPLKQETAKTLMDRWWEISHPDTGLADSIFMFECLPRTATEKVPVHSMAYNNRGAYMNAGTVFKYDDPSLDDSVRTVNRGFQEQVRAVGYRDPERKDGTGFYLNYDPLGDTIDDEAAFGSHAGKLRELKKKYDPPNVFDKLWKLTGKVEERYAA